MPEWLKGTGCKPVGYAYVGSNPTPSTTVSCVAEWARVIKDDRKTVKKGFGFITWDEGEDVFVHFRSIRGQGHRSLTEGQRVKFSVVRGEKGPQAEDVSAIR